MAKMEYSLIIEGFKAAGDMGAANGPPKQPGNGGPSAPSGDSGGGGGGTVNPKLAKLAEKGVNLQEKQPGFMGKLVKKMGINVGISSILKQSQIFTGTIGSIFQIFGALVDVILAPFLPIIVPIIRLLGNLIPMIHKTINGVLAWYDNNISPFLDSLGSKIGTWIADGLLGWLPEDMKTAIKTWFDEADWGKWVKNIALGVIFFGVLSRFGFAKLLGPILKILPKIPVIGPLLKAVQGVAGTILKSIGARFATALAPLLKAVGGVAMAIATKLGLGGLMTKFFPKAAKGGLKTSGGTQLKTAAQIRAEKAGTGGGGGGMFGKLKSGLNKLSPKSMMAAAKSAGPMGILKGVAKKAIPGLSSALLMYQGVRGAIDVFKSNQEAGAGFWKSLGKAGAVAGTATAAAGLSFVPGMGLIAPIAGGMATSAMRNAMMAKPPEGEGGDVIVKVQVGETEVVDAQFNRRNREITRAATSSNEANVAADFEQ